MKQRICYRAIDGKTYPCTILRKKDGLADIKLLGKEEGTYFVGVPVNKGRVVGHRASGYLVVR